MIAQFSIENFKSWRDTGLMRLAPMTGLFGSNSSGKTSLLQMLLLLKQTAESSDRSQVLHTGDERTLVDLGTFQELLFQHDLKNPLKWRIAWELSDNLEVLNPTTTRRRKELLFEDTKIAFEASLRWQVNDSQIKKGRPAVENMMYDFSGHHFGMKLASKSKSGYDLHHDGNDGTAFKFVRQPGRPWKLPPPSKFYGFPDQVRAYYQNAGFLSDFELAFEEQFKRIFYLGPLRDYPRRQYSWAGIQPTDMGRRGERVVDAILASREAGYKIKMGKGHQRLTLEERVAQWLKDLKLIESFNVKPITSDGKLFQVWVKRHARATEVLITDVGFGVSQILPVITLCYYAPEGSILLLEQPEIHLHPSVQAGLADVLIDAIKTRHIQIILESHSEHLLRRLQRRVAEEELTSNEAALYFCNMTDGESSLTPLAMDMFGTIENWPEDFFGDSFGEIAATSKAIMDRKNEKKRRRS